MKNPRNFRPFDGTRRETTMSGWRGLQGAVYSLGLFLFLSLWVRPRLGLHLFWNVLIPVAPALFVLAPGVWRNICPMGTTSMLPRYLGFSRKRKISILWSKRLQFIGFILLIGMIPLRHVILDLSGPATAIALLSFAVIAVTGGLFFDWKSAWCSGLCPVQHVEKLYGGQPLFRTANAHCFSCVGCVRPCLDSVSTYRSQKAVRGASRAIEVWMTGGFVGYIWGWFHVPNFTGGETWFHLFLAYATPLGASLLSLAIYLATRRFLPEIRRDRLQALFSAAAIVCYYWYRVPALFGFGIFPADGMLADMSATFPSWFPLFSRLVTTSFFAYYFLRSNVERRSWSMRPTLAVSES
jgi:hypothetical protein